MQPIYSRCELLMLVNKALYIQNKMQLLLTCIQENGLLEQLQRKVSVEVWGKGECFVSGAKKLLALSVQ